MNTVTLEQAAQILTKSNNILILTHQYPDGDTLGSGYALCKMLQQMNKNAKVLINGELQEKFEYLTEGIIEQDFTAQTVISVDVADTKLLGELNEYKNNIELCIDHHISNKLYAKKTYVDAAAAATTEIIFQLGQLLGIAFTEDIANCIYTGLTTDSGCFRYGNTTARTHRIAADMIEAGCFSAKINKSMFETVSRERLAIESHVISEMEYFAHGKIALIYTTKAILDKYNITDDELEGLSSIPRQVVGVSVGITLREKEEGIYKISLRTNDGVDASAICSEFGGGGHAAAAGCTIKGTLEQTKNKITQAAERAVNR